MADYIITMDTGEQFLSHHGVKGMKWGVWNAETQARRTGVLSKKNRYLNEDGSLTSSGKNRYLEQDANVAYKDLKKQIQKQRKDVHGGGNRWLINTPIGEHSKKYLDEIHKKEKEYKTSKKYLDWEKEYKTWRKKTEKQFDPSNIEKYTKEEEAILARKPKKNFNSPYDAAVSYDLRTREKKYAKGYLQGAGKDLSMAYLQDLGYNKETAEQLVDRMIKKNKSLGFV